MKEKICVYTAITGDYDNLHEIDEMEKGIDYYCFTNNKNIKSNTWKVIYIEDKNLSNVLLARKTKILGHPSINNNYDILLWMDGAIVFKKKIKEFIKTFLGKDDLFVGFKHGERKCIKDECDACYRYNKETKANIKNILDYYKKEGYPDNNGLIESTVFIRRTNNKLVDETMNLWFDMVLNYSKRDQLSFNYAIYKTGLSVRWINEKVFSNTWFDWIKHVSNKPIKKYRVYFGDEQEYDIDKDIQGEYIRKDDNYSFKIKAPCDNDFVVINVTDASLVRFNNIKIKGVSKKDYYVFNYIHNKKNSVFYNDDSIIKIDKPFKKGELLEFSIDMKKLEEHEVYDFISDVSVDNIIKEEDILVLKRDLNAKDDYINYLNKVLRYSPIARIILKISELKNKR